MHPTNQLVRVLGNYDSEGVTENGKKMTTLSDRNKKIARKVGLLALWVLSSLFFDLRILIIWLNNNFFTWRFVGFSLTDIACLVPSFYAMKWSIKFLTDKVSRVISFIPNVAAIFLAIAMFFAWLNEKIDMQSFLGRSEFTPFWFVVFEETMFLVPVLVWLSRTGNISDFTKNFLESVANSLASDSYSQHDRRTRARFNGNDDPTSRGGYQQDDGQESRGRSNNEDCSNSNRRAALKQALNTLGLNGRVTRTDIRNAYRDLVQVWHPDRFNHNPRLRAEAEKRLAEINCAYELLEEYFINNKQDAN